MYLHDSVTRLEWTAATSLQDTMEAINMLKGVISSQSLLVRRRAWHANPSQVARISIKSELHTGKHCLCFSHLGNSVLYDSTDAHPHKQKAYICEPSPSVGAGGSPRSNCRMRKTSVLPKMRRHWLEPKAAEDCPTSPDSAGRQVCCTNARAAPARGERGERAESARAKSSSQRSDSATTCESAQPPGVGIEGSARLRGGR